MARSLQVAILTNCRTSNQVTYWLWLMVGLRPETLNQSYSRPENNARESEMYVAC